MFGNGKSSRPSTSVSHHYLCAEEHIDFVASFEMANITRNIVFCLLQIVVSSLAKRNLTVYSSDTVPKITAGSTQNEANYTAPNFPLLGFKQYKHNPILAPNPKSSWESAYLYNPGAVVIDNKVWLLYRAQNESLVSAIGLAWSDDGYNFTRYTKPVVQPSEPYETHGTEDPRIVRVNGTFYMMYTGYDGTLAKLCVATSTDLVSWKKFGPVLPNMTDVNYRWDSPINAYTAREGWSKSGAIVPEKVNDLYHMQFGVSQPSTTVLVSQILGSNSGDRTTGSTQPTRLISSTGTTPAMIFRSQLS